MKVGDYVKTNDGSIGKIIECPFKSMFLDEIWADINDTDTIITTNVYKTSPKLIDLVEIGDFINNSKVIKIEEYNNEKYAYVEEMEFCNACDEYENVYYKEGDIKTIVTKEQFENYNYKVEEKQNGIN